MSIYVIVAAMLMLPLLTQSVIAVAPGNDAFQRTWARTDKPVADGQVSRTWMWGPEAFTETMEEEYVPYSGGIPTDISSRAVQYFDKSRMEITNPDSDASAIWYVTNGLLATELISGSMQVGDRDWIERQPAAVNVAGDANDPDGPTYATFTALSYPDFTVASAIGATITQRIDRSGNITDDPTLASHGVTAVEYVPDTGHNVASVFWSFMQAEGLIYEEGSLTTGALFPTAFYATGFPITEAYWATVRVGTTPRNVLMQCFERRCLTYTPDNPEGWQVEAGNVGQHYYAWRYEQQEEPLSGGIVFTGHGFFDIFTINADGSGLQQLTDTPDAFENAPRWSPSGQEIAFSRASSSSEDCNPCTLHSDVYVMNHDGSNLRQLTDDALNGNSSAHPSWSPDGRFIAFNSNRGGSNQIYVMDADGSNLQMLTAGLPSNNIHPDWSPNGQRFAFINIDEEDHWSIWTMDADGANKRQVANLDYFVSAPKWSPDNSKLAFSVTNGPLYVVNADGTDLQQLVANGSSPAWSPDGRHITFRYGPSFGGGGLHVMDPSGANIRLIYDGPGDDSDPDWKP